MKSENRALAVILVAVTVVVAVGGALIFLTAFPTTLPIPAGTTFTGNVTQTWLVHFNVSAANARLVGAWTAYDGFGYPALAVVDGTVGRPPDYLYRCPALPRWTQTNGSLDLSVAPGPHTLYWGGCFAASRVVITETVQLVSSP